VFAQLVCIKTNRVEAEKIWVFYTLSSMWSTNAMQSKALHRALAISASIYRQNKYCQAYNYGYCQQFACPTRCYKLYLAINKSCVEIPFHLGDVFYLSRGCTPSGKWIILLVGKLPKFILHYYSPCQLISNCRWNTNIFEFLLRTVLFWIRCSDNPGSRLSLYFLKNTKTKTTN